MEKIKMSIMSKVTNFSQKTIARAEYGKLIGVSANGIKVFEKRNANGIKTITSFDINGNAFKQIRQYKSNNASNTTVIDFYNNMRTSIRKSKENFSILIKKDIHGSGNILKQYVYDLANGKIKRIQTDFTAIEYKRKGIPPYHNAIKKVRELFGVHPELDAQNIFVPKEKIATATQILNNLNNVPKLEKLFAKY